MDDWPSPSAPPDPSDPVAVDLWLVQQEETFAELIAAKLTRIVRQSYDAFLDSLPPEDTITAAGDLYELESIVPRWRVVVRTDLVPRLERLYLTGSIAAFTVATVNNGEPRQEIPRDEIEGWARVVNENAVAYAQTATNRLANVGDTVFNMIKKRTATAIEKGATNEQLKQQIEQVAGFSEFRADVVARTEVGMAYGTGDYDGMTALGAYGPVEKEWLAAIDARTRPNHVEANGQRVPMNEPFQVGGVPMMYAKQPGAPAREVIQCRCTTLYHFAGDVRPDGSIVGDEALPVAPPSATVLPVQPAPPTTPPILVEQSPVPLPDTPPQPTPKPKPAPKPKPVKQKPIKKKQPAPKDTPPPVADATITGKTEWATVAQDGSDYLNTLPLKERSAVIDYGRQNFDKVNTFLRSKPKELTAQQSKAYNINLIEDAINNAPPLRGDATVYRGIEVPLVAEPGQVITDKAFLSTSFDRSIAELFARQNYLDEDQEFTILEITVPRGVRALGMNSEGLTTYEQELLLQRGTALRVVSSKKRGKQTIIKAIVEAT